METKKCSRCKEFLPTDRFYVKYRKPRTVLYPECKKCRKDMTEEYRKSDERKAYARDYYQGKKQEIRDKQNKYYKEHKTHVLNLKKVWVFKNKERRQETTRRYGKKLRTAFFDMYGRSCACCGETCEEFLTIEHKLGQRGIVRHKKQTGKDAYLIATQSYRPDLYEVLCMNCNFSKGRYGYCPHQKENK